MKAFNEELRYDYPLAPDSVVIDAGGYEGNWFSQIWNKYHCHIYVFEPVYEHWLKCSMAAFNANPVAPEFNKIKVYRAGLGCIGGMIEFGVSNDSSGLMSQAEKKEVVDIVPVCVAVGSGDIDLLKLNVEGMEYTILNSLIESDKIKQIKNIQVQFHYNFKEARQEHAALREKLLTTHEPEWDSEPTWQNFRLK